MQGGDTELPPAIQKDSWGLLGREIAGPDQDLYRNFSHNLTTYTVPVCPLDAFNIQGLI